MKRNRNTKFRSLTGEESAYPGPDIQHVELVDTHKQRLDKITEVGAGGSSVDFMFGEDAVGSGVSTERSEEQRSASAPPHAKTIMSEEITGE